MTKLENSTAMAWGQEEEPLVTDKQHGVRWLGDGETESNVCQSPALAENLSSRMRLVPSVTKPRPRATDQNQDQDQDQDQNQDQDQVQVQDQAHKSHQRHNCTIALPGSSAHAYCHTQVLC
ncbi:hypothetical protein EYF80_010768 [Liparis tanakae]|uniref:Uncharacterized protein n=1 Tax=Liparis tanakae TaxID=230148 RepID=A0A4Z2IM31_9TELE|nr:hypothetical protein EYF80_010768 [Liparis tanakae]